MANNSRGFAGGEYHEPLSPDEDSEVREKSPSPQLRQEQRTNERLQLPVTPIVRSEKAGAPNNTSVPHGFSSPAPRDRAVQALVEDLSPPLSAGSPASVEIPRPRLTS